MLQNIKDIVRQVNTLGLLPFFKGEIEGFSIEECLTPDYWFQDEGGGYGVWDWKNDIMVEADCAYGKFYRGKACFVSLKWFPDLLNWRRSRYNPSADEQRMLAAVKERNSLLSSEMKKLCTKGFDGALARLQMGGALMTADFEYKYTRDGRAYGWSVARYCTPEAYFGAECLQTDRTPEESRQRLQLHLAEALPQASPKQIDRILD